ncbi:hypothetical protein HNP52_003646 [Sphingomonas kyeonggiensis]|uniref:Glycerophosphoryl diester phosphodiesterase membrane domain-containing protein n=1 Tax=Sphingomonas kyeonggiensis TaxID=1268553 RepID=A0A7W7K3V4_9SPHN|nr:hypothetical protein [Sphingomonas kyeonggiensis]MBB4840554.1 hypothetical protein [Sphingomonas kyeonggiensis]
MSLTSRGIFLDAVSLFRAERELLIALAGMFFVVPMLGAVLLVSGLQLPATQDAEKLREAIMAFYDANLLTILAISLVMDFGSFAIFNLFLRGDGRTLGQVLLLALKRFGAFFVLNTIAGLLFSFGLSLFVIPGLYMLVRTWLAGPAFAADPAIGILGAFREGWRRSAGVTGFALLGLASMIFFLALGLVLIAGGILGTIAGLIGGVQAIAPVSWLVSALIGGAAWAALALIRVAAYRLGGAPRQGI